MFRLGVVIVTLSLLSGCATELMYGWKSKHWVSEDTTNDTHDMVGVRYNHAVVGTFNNSYGRESYFAGYYDSIKHSNWELFGVVGAVRGYTVCFGDDSSNTNTCPFISGGVTYLGVNEWFMPTLYQFGDASVIGFRVRF